MVTTIKSSYVFGLILCFTVQTHAMVLKQGLAMAKQAQRLSVNAGMKASSFLSRRNFSGQRPNTRQLTGNDQADNHHTNQDTHNQSPYRDYISSISTGLICSTAVALGYQVYTDYELRKERDAKILGKIITMLDIDALRTFIHHEHIMQDYIETYVDHAIAGMPGPSTYLKMPTALAAVEAIFHTRRNRPEDNNRCLEFLELLLEHVDINAANCMDDTALSFVLYFKELHFLLPTLYKHNAIITPEYEERHIDKTIKSVAN